MFNKVLLPVDMQDSKTARRSLEAAGQYLENDSAELHVMAVLCFLGLVVFALSAATGLLWSFGVALPAIIGIFVNLGWLLVAYRRGLH